MRTLWLAFFFFLLHGQITAQTKRDMTGWKLVWNEEFDSAGLPPTLRCLSGLHANEPQLYASGPDNVNVSGGALHLVCRKKDTLYNGITYHYTSGEVYSTATFLHGYFEVRAKSPKGRGLWPAFWMFTGAREQCNYREIDFFENDGADKRFTSNNYFWQTETNCNDSSVSSDSYPLRTKVSMTAYHVWGCEITADSLRFYFDGKETRSVKTNYFSEYPMPLILNLALFEWFGSRPIRRTRFPASFDIDYIRVYTR